MSRNRTLQRVEARLTLEDRLKMIIGDLVLRNAALAAQAEEKDAKIAELEKAKEEKPE